MDMKQTLGDAKRFEKEAREFLSKKWNVTLNERKVKIGKKCEKRFDCVSEDGKYVGDVKYLKNIQTPAAKWSTIAEFVWLLEKVKAQHKFLVFGRHKEVSQRWLRKHKSLVKNVRFYFLNGQKLEKFTKSKNKYNPVV